MTGLVPGQASPSSSDALYETKTTSGPLGYTTTASFPRAGALVHTVTHYDTYDRDGNGSVDYAYVRPSAQTSNYAATASPHTRGRATITLEAIVPANAVTAPTQYLTTVSHYDSRGRVLLTDAQHHLGGTDRTWTSYAFPGWPLRSRRQHQVGR